MNGGLPAGLDLAACFRAAAQALRREQEALNRLDAINGNHGDHMVVIFDLAERAAAQRPQSGLAEAMAYAGDLLGGLPDNGSAQMYGRGLVQFARQFERYGVDMAGLAAFCRAALQEDASPGAPGQAQGVPGQARGAPGQAQGAPEVLKALASGLAAWQQVENGQIPSEKPVGLGSLFDLGINYLQAKQRGGSKAEIIAGAAAASSPLSTVAHRRQSGEIALRAFLEALAAA